MEGRHDNDRPDGNRLEQLHDELNALRKKQRRTEVVTVIALFLSCAAIAGAIAAGRSTFEGILANELRLGRPSAGGWAWLHQRGNDGGIELAMGVSSAPSRVAVGIDGTGTGYLVVRGPSGSSGLEASVDDVTGPKVSLIDSQGLKRVVVLLQPDGAPYLALVDGEGDIRLSAQLQSTGEPRIVLGDDAGIGRLYIDITSNGSPLVYAMDSNETGRLQFGIGTGDEGYFMIRNEDGGEQIVIGDDSREPQTILIRREGNEFLDILNLGTAPSD